MVFAGLNWLAIFTAGGTAFGFGALWYGLLGKAWMRAAGLSEDDIKGSIDTQTRERQKPAPLPFILAALASLFMAITMAGLMAHMVMDVQHGLITAVIVWAGFILPAILVNYSFQMRPFTLTLIDAGHWLGVLLLIGMIIGYMGVSG